MGAAGVSPLHDIPCAVHRPLTVWDILGFLLFLVFWFRVNPDHGE